MHVILMIIVYTIYHFVIRSLLTFLSRFLKCARSDSYFGHYNRYYI